MTNKTSKPVNTTTMTTTTTAEPPATVPSAQPLLDLSRLILAIRRRRRLWLCMSIIGLLVGAAVAILMPTPPTATVRILVVHEDDQPSDTGNLVRTDVALLDTAKVAGEALQRVGSSQKPEDFLQEYEVVGLTNNVVEVTVQATTNAAAISRAKALAEVFIADHVSRIQSAADSEAQALIDQRDRVQGDLKQVNAQITTAENKARQQAENQGLGQQQAQNQPNAAGLDSLYARRAELTSRISDLSQQAEEAGIGAPRVAAGTQIVDAPRVLPQSTLMTLVTSAGIGLLLGLILGWTVAAISGVIKDKPVLRQDIATHLGASVIAQLTMPRRGLARLWRGQRLVRERKQVAGTLVRLVRGGHGSVSVLELGSRRIAAALTVDVATRLATDRDVVIVEDPAGRVVADDLPGRQLGELTGRADRPIRIIGADETGPGRAGEIRIGIGSVTPGTAWTDLNHLGGETLLVVRTGFANTPWLHTVARQLADNGIPIIGVVLVDPDPRDKSDGTLWDGLHTALRGRRRFAEEQSAGRPKPFPARKPEWAPEPVARATPLPPVEPDPAPALESSADSVEPGAPQPRPAAPVPAREPVAVFPAPVPANGVNGVRANPELPTKRFAPVQPHLMNQDEDGEQHGHDLPTKRFAPVRQDLEELAHRRTNG